MFINPTEKDLTIRNVSGLSPLENAMVRAYLQGCVYSWCKNNQSQDGSEEPKWFKAQYFLGEDNYYWQGTPLFCLYAKRLRQYDDDSEKAAEQAARDAGHLLKAVLRDDKRYFRTETDERGYRWYQWDGNADVNTLDASPQYHTYISRAKQQLERDIDSFIKTD